MTRHRTIVKAEIPRAAKVDPGDPSEPAIGRWYWVRFSSKNEPDEELLGCVVRLGSNYAEVDFPANAAIRIHFDNFFARCRHEPDPEAVIGVEVEESRREIRALSAKIRALTDRLAITPGKVLGEGGETSALALRGGNEAVDSYKTALVEAKEKTLPELFSQIRDANEAMRVWLSAPLLPLEAQAAALEPTIAAIKNRIFSVELYAGLVESVEQVADGEPAPMTDKIHLMQRRCYMDEECLARYEVGGMELKDLPAFDRWLARPANRDRILPFPRCVVAFRVRRSSKLRRWRDVGEFFRCLEQEDEDKFTYLYMRNGDRLFRLRTGVEFDAKLFPDAEHRLLDRPLYMNLHDRDKTLISEDEFNEMVEREDRENAEAIAKRRKLPKKEQWHVSIPHEYFRESKNYKPFRRESVYYDDVGARVNELMTRHNRLVLVLQGILDRSPVFHPHPPWQIWTHDGFEQALVLVHDDSRALVAGDAPDFEAYRARLNASIRVGSVTVGQEVVWELAEGAKEERRRAERGRSRDYATEVLRYRPPGNPGPGRIARVSGYSPRSKKCEYEWDRKRQTVDRWGDDKPGAIRCRILVDSGCLFNVDAYEPGDFQIFFDDPRTRADYLRWAPLLLAAEEYRAGNIEVPPLPPPPAARAPSDDGKILYQKKLRRRAMNGKVVRLVRSITRRDGKKFEKGTLWIASQERGDLFSIKGCDARGRRDDRFVRSVHISDVEAIERQPKKIEEED